MNSAASSVVVLRRSRPLISSPVVKRMTKISYREYRFPPEIIQQAIWCVSAPERDPVQNPV